jgi:DNA-directed RNA polymerase specialized sigma24 family protein
MTPRSDFHDVLASPFVRRRLTAMVSKRVPSHATEDVVQSVLCDALAAEAVPEVEAVPRWLSAIARNKVADFHRRVRRRAEVASIEPSTEDPVVERDLLGHAASIAPDRRALEWIVRVEHGESFEEIARAEKLPAPAVRQRVSRLRRALRAALLAAAAFGLVVLSRSRTAVETMHPDPSAATSLDGRWHVASVTCPTSAPSNACTAAHDAHARINGNTATVGLRGGSLAIDIADTVREYHARITPAGSTLRIESDLGAVTLERD